MFDTIREYAGERRELYAELDASAREAHAEYFSEVARGRNLDDLSAELGNLQAAWSYWVGRGDLEQLHGLLDPLWAVLETRGLYQAAVELTNDLLGVIASVPPSAERTREEIVLRTSLARGLMAIRGYTQEVDEAYGRAVDLSETAGSVPKRFPVLRSLATLHVHRGEFEQAAAVGRELRDLATHEDDPAVTVEANVVLGSSLAFLGEVPRGLDHLERAIAQFVPEQQGSGGLRLGPSAGVVARNTSALLLWMQGYPDRAREQATSAIELAQALGHPFTLAYALFHAALLDLWRRDFDLAAKRSVGALDVAEEHDYRVWSALALAFHGAALVGLGRITEGIERTDRGIDSYQRLDSPPVFWPILCSVKAGAEGLAGRRTGALEVIEQAIELSGRDNIVYPGFAVQRGDLLLGLGNTPAAELSFRSGLEVAADFGLRTPQLHAAVRLARLAGMKRDDSDGLLELYETFSEGFDELDLTEARAALAELGVQVAEASANSRP